MILSVYDTKRTGEPAVQRSDANAAATPIEAPATAPRVVQVEMDKLPSRWYTTTEDNVSIGDFLTRYQNTVR
jgi:hypothetical protein